MDRRFGSFTLRASLAFLALACAATASHAGLSVTSMDQTVSAQAAAQHTYSRLVYPDVCYYPPCAPERLETSALMGNTDAHSDTGSATDLSAPLDQHTSAHASYNGIVADSTSVANMAQQNDGLTLTSSGSIYHLFPTSVDTGVSYNGEANGWDVGLGQATAFNPNIISTSLQSATLHIDQTTQILLDWQIQPADMKLVGYPMYSLGKLGLSITDSSGQMVASSNGAGTGSGAVTLDAGDYALTMVTGLGQNLSRAGELNLSWSASASVRAVPEASTFSYLAMGLMGIAALARRRPRL
jgi:hypothetical protein